MIMKDILKDELELIRVSEDEILHLKKVASDFIKSLNTEGLRAYVGGSLAKGTLIRKNNFSESGNGQSEMGNGVGGQDVDIFVVFDYSEDIPVLEKVLGKIKLPGVLKKVHGTLI